MMRLVGKRPPKTCLIAATLVLAVLIAAETTAQIQPDESVSGEQPHEQLFRLDRTAVAGGAELITISARLRGPTNPDVQSSAQTGLDHAHSGGRWIPLVTVLRDTLGDSNADNDRLRYVWALTYTRPSTTQRAASAIPFLYTRIGSKQHSAQEPPPLMDLAAADHEVWQKVRWFALQSILLDPYCVPLRAATRSYQRNLEDYRKGQIIRAFSVLALYQALKGEQVFTDSEFQKIQARLLLTERTFGGIVDEQNLSGFYQKQTSALSDTRGHNWELLRQQAEAGGLYFEPLEMPDGSASHALLWIARTDLASPHPERFDGRFLNIENPWKDKRLRSWQGYSETRYFDADNRPVPQSTPGARAVELIPLALYGLESPRIPLLLVDFRDGLNPKRREMSRRVLNDVTKNVLAFSAFGDLPYFLGHRLYDFFTGRRGVDINQPSRLREYAQLKLLLSLSNSLTPALQNELTRRLEKVSLNPAENDLEAEASLAEEQYQALLTYAARPDGLPTLLERDRRAEMTALEHSHKAQFSFKLANVLTFGLYTHREPPTPDLTARLDLARSLTYHRRFLREVSRSSPLIEVAWDLLKVKESLQFIAAHGNEANAKAAQTVVDIFARTQDEDTRRSCLESLSRINNKRARIALTQISQNQQLDQIWRQLSAQYLERSAPVDKNAASVVPKKSTIRTQQ